MTSKRMAVLHAVLALPKNCRIDAASVAARFFHNEVSLRLECPDFPESKEGCSLPEVFAIYGSSEVFCNNIPTFIGRSMYMNQSSTTVGDVTVTVIEYEPDNKSWRDEEPML